MYTRNLLLGGIICVAAVGRVFAACASPSFQVQSSATSGFATAVVTFVSIGNNNTANVDGRILTKGPGGPLAATVVATAYRTNTNQGSLSFSGNYTTWQLHSDQTGLTTTQVRYITTVAGTVPPIPVTAGTNNPDPSQVTTQGSQVAPALTTLLTNNTVCVGSGPVWENQEWHRSGGELWDWKKGNGHASPSGTVDPTKKLGTWAINGAEVSYTYDAFGSATHAFSVWKNTDAEGPGMHTYSFCQGTVQKALAKIYSGEVSCTTGGTRQ